MNVIVSYLRDFIREEDGLTTVEYAIAGTLVGLAVVTAFTALGGAVGDAVCKMKNVITSGSAGLNNTTC